MLPSHVRDDVGGEMAEKAVVKVVEAAQFVVSWLNVAIKVEQAVVNGLLSFLENLKPSGG